MAKKDNQIMIAQYIATILVVILHSELQNGWGLDKLDGYVQIVLFENIIRHICQIAVPTFFFFSGFLMYLNYKPERYFTKLKSRLYTLVVPYMIWNTVATIYFVLLTHIPFIADKMNQPPKRIGLNLIREIVMSDNSPLWYIRNLLVLTVAAIFIYQILKIRTLAILMILITALAAQMFHWDYYSVQYWIPMYCIGGYIAIHYKKIPRLTVTMCLTLLFGVIVSFFMDDMMYLYRLIASLVVPAMFYELSKNIANPSWYMNINLYIYCTHFLLISTFEKLWKIIFGISPVSAWICYLSTPVIVLYIISLSAYYWKKYFPRSWAIVTGGRS